MIEQQNPITPPHELVEQWIAEIWHEGTPVRVAASDLHIATQAYRAGADQELEACCEWLDNYLLAPKGSQLRAARRPKPPSLKEQALEALSEMEDECLMVTNSATIRRALEQLDD